MYKMLESYGPYKKGKSIIVTDEGCDWVRTNKGIYIPKFAVETPEKDVWDTQE